MKFCSLASGSSGNSLYIESKECKLLIDAGLSGKAIEERLQSINVSPKELTGIFVSHEHIDHIKGVGVLSRKFNLPIYARERAWSELTSIGKIKEEHQRYLGINEEIGDLKVECFSVSHDSADPVGFSFYHENQKVSIATDTGYVSSEVHRNLFDSDLLFMEANYDEKMLEYGMYPKYLKKRIASQKGHLSNRATGESLAEVLAGKTKKVILAHLSAENNLPKLAYHTIKDILSDIDLEVNRDFDLEVAPRHSPGNLIDLEKL